MDDENNMEIDGRMLYFLFYALFGQRPYWLNSLTKLHEKNEMISRRIGTRSKRGMRSF